MRHCRTRTIMLACCLLAACQGGGEQPTTATGRPAISPARRLVARIREDAEGQPRSAPGNDIVMLDRSTATTLAVGDTLRVELKASSGTGYQWVFVGCDSDLSSTTSSLMPLFDWKKGEGKVEHAEPGKPGGPAHWVFEFNAARAGQTTLQFALGRPWEKGAKPADLRTLKVQVK